MMIRIFTLIGLLLAPAAHAQVPIYSTIKDMVQAEVESSQESELAIQRFALGIYYDFELETVSEGNEPIPFEMEKEEYVDLSLQNLYEQMCGKQEDKKNDYITCRQAQKTLKTVVERNAWVRSLGRDLQAIASGYEAGIDGYPGKIVDVIAKLPGINHIWRATNDPFVTPIVEALTRARPWPEQNADAIEEKAKDITKAIEDLEKEWGEKKDRTELSAAVWRYRNGVRYVKDHEGVDCEAANQQLDAYLDCMLDTGDQAFCDATFGGQDPAMIMLQRRWCNVEEKMEELRGLIRTDNAQETGDEHIMYPTYTDQKNNFSIWMRYDDVGLQWYLPIEPVQATLYHPDYGDCIEGGNIRSCYEQYSEFLIRGGKYPRKLGAQQRTQQPSLMGGGTVPSTSEEDSEEIRKNNSVVQEPEQNEGICSHPFSKRGYLCRSIESEACDVTVEQEEQLAEAGTGGVLLTRCEPERFRDDIARRSSGDNICGIGGWRDSAQPPLPVDTAQKEEGLEVPPCAKCWIDVECKDECVPGKPGFAFTSYEKADGIINICAPNTVPGGDIYYLLYHELVHAQQVCAESNIATYDRAGLFKKEPDTADECCASEREAYFAQCKLMALDGILEKAGISIDQCASVFANRSCEPYDDDPEDDNYVCTNDSVDPSALVKATSDAQKELELNLPKTCAEALEHPRIKAIYNSLPLSCSPGCQYEYNNTIGNNLCYTGQCIEETHENARYIPGRVGLTTASQTFPWDACEKPDPQLGDFEVAPALLGPKLPPYRPALLLQQLDRELCQINGLPARTPPVICAYDHLKRLNLPPLSLLEVADDLSLQVEEYDATGLGIQYAASAIGSRITANMFTQYLQPAARSYADLLNTMYDIFSTIGDLEFPTTMCPRFTADDFTCAELEQ